MRSAARSTIGVSPMSRAAVANGSLSMVALTVPALSASSRLRLSPSSTISTSLRVSFSRSSAMVATASLSEPAALIATVPPLSSAAVFTPAR